MRSATKGLMVSIVGVEKEFRQRGIASTLYQSLMSAAFDKLGPFFFVADSCGEGVSYDARFLWRSLQRRYPSQGWVLAVPSKSGAGGRRANPKGLIPMPAPRRTAKQDRFARLAEKLESGSDKARYQERAAQGLCSKLIWPGGVGTMSHAWRGYRFCKRRATHIDRDPYFLGRVYCTQHAEELMQSDSGKARNPIPVPDWWWEGQDAIEKEERKRSKLYASGGSKTAAFKAQRDKVKAMKQALYDRRDREYPLAEDDSRRRNPEEQVDLFAGFSQKPAKARKPVKASTKASKPPKTAPARSQGPGGGVLCDPGPLIKERTPAGPISDAALPDHSIAETTWKVVDLSKLLWSNEWSDGATIKAYPKVYQPRDRRRPSYREQHHDIVKYFNPEILMWAATAQQGAPIVVDDPSLSKKMIVASGNGRTMALAEIYLRKKSGGGRSGPAWPGKQRAYKNELERWSSLLGITVPTNIKHPVLVRVLDSSVDGPHFARLANETLIAELNATEQAIKDANKMTFAVADKYVPFIVKVKKDDQGRVIQTTRKAVPVGSPKNKPFVEAFIRSVAGEQARNEMMTVTPQGAPKLADTGIQRIEYALFRFAYGAAVDDVLIYLTEQEVPTASALLRGLMWSSAYWIAFEREVREGRMEERYDLRASLVSAVLRGMRSKETHGMTPIEAAWQRDTYAVMAGGAALDDIEAYWMRAFYRAIPAKISNMSLADVCREYCAEAIAISSPAALASAENFDLFGAVGEVKERAAVAATLPPPEFLAQAIATALFNRPFAPRFTKGGKQVRDVEAKLMPTSMAEVARSAGETFWEICQHWDTQWQSWLIDWAKAVKGTSRRPAFRTAYNEAKRWFSIGVRQNQRQENIKAFDAKVKGDAAYAAADKAWKASLK